MTGTLVIRAAGRAVGSPFTAPFAVAADWVCSAVPTGAHCTGPDVAAGGSVTAYLNVTADPGSAGTTPVSVTVGAPGATSVTATGTTGVAASGFAASFAGRGHLGVTEVGAPLLSCPPQANGCADALARTGPAATLNNDNWAMVALDQDADKATQSSSAAQLALPDGAVVTWAGLYWSGNVAPGTSSDRLATISLAGPGATGYSTVTAARVETGLSTGRGPAYQSFADVTKVVAAGGSGEWWAADAAAEPGLGRYAGWSLVVVYKDPALPEGSVSVVDGFSKIAPGEDVLLTLPGTAGLAARVGMVAWEGDAGIDGDILTLDGSRLVPATGAASETNVADSFAVGSSSANTLGVDAKPLSGALFAGPTAQVRAFTRQDVILLGVLTVSSTR